MRKAARRAGLLLSLVGGPLGTKPFQFPLSEMVRSAAASRIWEQNSATIHVSHTPRLFGGALAPQASQKDNVLHVLASQSSAMVERRQNRSLYGVAGFG